MEICSSCNNEFEKLHCKNMCRSCYEKDTRKRKPSQFIENKNGLKCSGCYKSFNKLHGHGLCRSCYNKQWKSENHEHHINYMEDYHKNNKKEIIRELKPKKITNLEEKLNNRRNYNKLYRLKNREKLNNKNKERNKMRAKTDPFYAFKTNVRKIIGNSIKRGGYEKNSRTENLICCSFKDLMSHLGPKPEGYVDIDHLVPCAQGKTEEEVIKLQHYTNLRWMDASLNRSKQDNKTPEGEELCKSLLGREWID